MNKIKRLALAWKSFWVLHFQFLLTCNTCTFLWAQSRLQYGIMSVSQLAHLLSCCSEPTVPSALVLQKAQNTSGQMLLPLLCCGTGDRGTLPCCVWYLLSSCSLSFFFCFPRILLITWSLDQLVLISTYEGESKIFVFLCSGLFNSRAAFSSIHLHVNISILLVFLWSNSNHCVSIPDFL